MDVNSLKIAIDTRDAITASKNLNTLNTTVNKVDKSSMGLNKQMVALAGTYVSFQAIKGVTSSFIRQADTVKLLESQLKLVTTSSKNLLKVQKDLFQLSQDTRQSIEATTNLYARMARATQSAGTSQEDLLIATKSINQALIISGASAQEASSAITQLSQGLASGVLRGEEFNSITENGSRIAIALANSLGVTAGELREMAKAGKLTSEVVMKALIEEAGTLDKEFKKMGITVGQSMENISSSMLQLVGAIEKGTNASDSLVGVLINVNDAINSVSEDDIDKYVKLAKSLTILGGSIVATSLAFKTYTATTGSATLATLAMSGATGEMARRMVVARVASLALGTAMKAIPFVAIAGTIALIADNMLDASKASDELADSIGKTGKKLEDLTKAQLDYRKSVIDEATHDAFIEMSEARMDSDRKQWHESEKEHIKDLARTDDAIQKYQDMLKVQKEINQAKKEFSISEADDFSDEGGKKTVPEMPDYTEADAHVVAYYEHLAELAQQEEDEQIEREEALRQLRIDNANTIGQMKFDLMAEEMDELEAIEERKMELSNLGLEMMKSEAEKIEDTFWEIAEASHGIWSTDEMEGFFDLMDKRVKDSTKKQSKANERVDDLGGFYRNTTSLMNEFYDKDDSRKKKQQQIDQAMHAANMAAQTVRMVGDLAEMSSKGVIAVLTQGTGDPYTAFARMAAMAGVVASLGVALSGGGSVGGGGKSEVDIQAENYDSETSLITSRLDRQIELLESIDREGTAKVYQSDLAKATYERTVGALTFDVGAISGDAGNVEKYIKDSYAFIVNSFEAISDVDIGTVRSGGGVAFDASGLIGNLSETMKFIKFMDESLKSGNIDFRGRQEENFQQVSPEAISELMNQAQEAISEYAISMIDIVGEMGDAKDSFKDIYDDLTNTATYREATLKKAFEDVDKIRGEKGFAEYLVEQIDGIQAVQDSLSENDIALLLSQNFDDAEKQAEVIDRLREETGLALENGAKDALNYIDAIELVSEAMITSRDNIKSFAESFMDEQQLVDAMAMSLNETTAINMEQLIALTKRLSSGVEGLSDEELDLLEANKSLIESLDTTADSISSLEGILSSLDGVINRLRGSALGSSYTMAEYYKSMSKTLSLSGSDNYEDFASSLSDTISKSSVLSNTNAFSTSRDMQFAQLVAANQFETLEEETIEQIDYLRMIEENTSENNLLMLELLMEMGAKLDEALLPSSEIEQWVQQDDGTSTWTSSGGAVATIATADIGSYSGEGNFSIATKTGNVLASDVMNFVDSALNDNDPLAVYNKAVIDGISANSLDALMGWEAGTSNSWAEDNNLVPFANGGIVTKPVNALIGEAGYSEAVIPLKDPSDPLGQKALIEEIRMLRGEVTTLKNDNNYYSERIDNNTQTDRFAVS